MDWAELTIVFFASHLVGDFLLQTEWQATRKLAGLGRNREARRALLSHIAVYTLCFVPALIWIATERDPLLAIGIGVLIAVPHLVIDDMRLLRHYMIRVKHCPSPPSAALSLMVDQSMHFVCLWVTALLATA